MAFFFAPHFQLGIRLFVLALDYIGNELKTHILICLMNMSLVWFNIRIMEYMVTECMRSKRYVED